jgi:DNA-binding CsgD family transcriptional regulator
MMTFAGGPPPGPNSGDISALTQALRPPLRLSPRQCDSARRWRRGGRPIPEIADRLSASVDDVREALATLRTRNGAATRRTLNVTLAAHDFVVGEIEDGEVCWETVDRLLGELAIRRAAMGAPITRLAPRR